MCVELALWRHNSARQRMAGKQNFKPSAAFRATQAVAGIKTLLASHALASRVLTLKQQFYTHTPNCKLLINSKTVGTVRQFIQDLH